MWISAASFANILLNITARRMIASSSNYYAAIFSTKFVICFMVGMVSLLSLIKVYSFGVSISRGILLMGAISILGGSLIGVLLFKQPLTKIEWAIFSLLSILMVYRWFISSN